MSCAGEEWRQLWYGYTQTWLCLNKSLYQNMHKCKCICVNVEMKKSWFGVLSSEFGCKRFYSTNPLLYCMLEIWRILGPSPITVNPSHPTIPHHGLRGSVTERKHNDSNAKADSRSGVWNGSTFFVMHKWCMMWGNTKQDQVCVLIGVACWCVGMLGVTLVRSENKFSFEKYPTPP